MSTPAALLRSHEIAPLATRKRGRPKIIDPKAFASEIQRIRATEEQIEKQRASRNRSLGWEKRRAAKQESQAAYAAEYRAQHKIAAGAHLCRCLNPSCLVWFASWKQSAKTCSPECRRAMTQLVVHCPVGALRAAAVQASKRNAGFYDSPKLTPYAKGLIATLDHHGGGLDEILHAATLAAESRTRGLASGIADGTRENRFMRQEDGDTFSDFYLLGSEWAAGHPHWPCDHSGLRSCHSPIKRYNTTTTP